MWERIFSIPGLDERYTSDVLYSPDGKSLAVGTAIGEDYRIQLLDPKNGESRGELKGHTWKPWTLQFNSSGDRLYSAGWDGVIRVWDLAKKEQIRVENSERASGVCTMSPDGKTLAFADDAGAVHLVDSQTGARQRTFDLPDVVFNQLVYSSDGTKLAGGGSNPTDVQVYVWDAATGAQLHHWQWPKGRDVHSTVESLSLSADAGRLAAAVFRQSKCYVFDLPSDKQIAELPHRQVYGLSLHPDGQLLATAGWDRTIRIWNCDDGNCLKELQVGNNKQGDTRMYGVVFSPDKQRLAALRMDRAVGVYDTELNPLFEFDIKHNAVFGSFQFSKNGLWIAVGAMDGTVSIFDASSGELLWDRAKHDSYVYNVEFGPEDRTLLTGADDGVDYLWDLNSEITDVPVNWTDLAQNVVGPDAMVAFAAFQFLAEHPDEALGPIRDVVEAEFSKIIPADDTQIEPLLSALGSDSAASREAAAQQLTSLGISVIADIDRAVSDVGEDQQDSERTRLLKSIQVDIHKKLWQLQRAFYLVAVLDNSDAEGTLDKWFEASPNVAIKKQVFLAKKYREKWHRRVSGERQ